MKKFSLVVAAMLMVVFVKAQDVDCDQGDGSNNFENGFQMVAGFDIKRADDFLVSAGNTLNIQTISINVITQERINQIEFIFYEDNNGAPGDVLPESVINSPDADHQLLVGEAFGYNVYQVYVDVDLNFEGGTDGASYWMQPTATAATGVVNAFWEVTSVGSLGQPIHSQGEVDSPGGPWSADEDGNHGVFKLYCEQTDPPDPPVLPCGFDITGDVEPITRVVFSDIDNTSSAPLNGSPALEDFTDIEGYIEQGTAYDIAIEGNTNGGYTSYFTAFIDYSGEDQGEFTDFDIFEIGSITDSDGTDGQQATGTITLDGSVPDGTYIMRIIKNYNSSPINPCSSYNWGQGEDYTLIVYSGEPQDHCIPEGGSNGGDEILNFTLSDLSNDSDPSEGEDGYSDYSESVDPANLQAGETYVASLTSGGGNLLHGAAIWIDYNDNGIFQSSEMVASLPATIEAETTVNFPPFTVADFPGTHRLRVQYSYNVDGANMDPCTVTGFAETEDYSVEVAEMEGCDGIPDAGVALDDFSVCPNAAFNISVTGATPAANGLVRIWESSLAGEGSWSEMSGATGSIYMVEEGITVPMDYRYKLSCDEGEFVFSDIISVSLSALEDCYCTPYFMLDCFYTDDMIDDFILVGDEGTSINDEATGCSDDGYDDRTDQSVTLTRGHDYIATVTTGIGFDGEPIEGDVVAIWIDFNDDAVFDESERVATGELNTGDEITVSVPGNAGIGEHRMRAIVYYADEDIADEIDSCNDAGFEMGETHDYMVNIIEEEGACSQETPGGADVDNGFGSLHLLQVANDLAIDANGTFTLNSIKFNALVEPGIPVDGVELHFYKDSDTGGPGEEVGATAMLTPTSVDNIGEAFGFDRMEVSVDIDEPITFTGSNTEIVYWIGVTIDYAGESSFMEITNTINTPNEAYFYDNISETWIAGSDPVDGFDDEADGVISFYGICGEIVWECPEFEANIGDDCEDEDGAEGVLDDNCDCISDIVDNINDVAGFSFTMYPNPVDRTGSLTLSSNQAIDRYEVLDVTGKVVDAETVSNKNEIEVVLSNYSSGLYILKAYSGSDFSTQKMIVR